MRRPVEPRAACAADPNQSAGCWVVSDVGADVTLPKSLQRKQDGFGAAGAGFTQLCRFRQSRRRVITSRFTQGGREGGEQGWTQRAGAGAPPRVAHVSVIGHGRRRPGRVLSQGCGSAPAHCPYPHSDHLLHPLMLSPSRRVFLNISSPYSMILILPCKIF